VMLVYSLTKFPITERTATFHTILQVLI
jgi:hypothetical protein